MALPDRIPVARKRDSRWRSQAHTGFVREFCCAMCGSRTNVIAAHVRLGSHAGQGRKPDDWRTAPLCDGPFSNSHGHLGCHNRQHVIGEETFWSEYERRHGQSVEHLLKELCAASPKRRDIERIQRERGNG